MSQGVGVSDILFLLLLGVAGIILYLRRDKLDWWSDDLESDFRSALETLHVESYVLIVDRVMKLGGGRTPEVYRILRDSYDHYFLYMKTENDKGVIKPLTKERALLAAKMSGYPI
jgi:hypothetical protein